MFELKKWISGNEPVARDVGAVCSVTPRMQYARSPRRISPARSRPDGAYLNSSPENVIGAAQDPSGRGRGAAGKRPYKRLCAQHASGDYLLEEIHDRPPSVVQEDAR
jgi:hypothetical protein